MMKFCIKTLGCKVNSYESEYIYSLFVKKGYVFSEEADIYIINTCTVTNQSDRKSRQIINSIRRNYKNAIIIVCGCYSQNCYQTGKLDDIDADIVIGNKDKSKIIDYLEKYLEESKSNTKFYDLKNVEFEDMEITTPQNRTRAFVKIEDGCNNFCTYCVIPYVRGCVRSKSKDKVIEEVNYLVKNGHKEIVLTGIHTGAYNDHGYDFACLLNDLVKINGLERLRISSIEINELNERVLSVYEKSDVLVPHLHIPLQAGSDEILKLMNRKYDKDFFRKKIDYIRNIKKDVSITTDVIVGFPNETDELFNKSVDFIKEIGFTKIHVFPYSDRDGTVSSKMNDGKVLGNVKKERVKELLNLSLDLEKKYYTKFYGRKMKVLIEEKKDGFYLGHTDNYIKVKLKGNYEINKIYEEELSVHNIVQS